MSRPRVLCVDDSEAILALEQAVLGGRFAVSTAVDGVAALEALAAAPPDCVVLDLSMPRLDGDEVLRRMRADPALAGIPVVVVSSETRRQQACLAAGATAFLPKPVRGDALLLAVGEAIEGAAAARRRASLAVLPVGVGPLDLGVPLERVAAAALLPETTPLPGGPPHADRLADVHGAPAVVVDLAAVLGVRHAVRVVDRRLVVLEREGRLVGFACDRIADPVEVPPERVTPAERVGGAAHPPLDRALVAVAEVDGRPLAVLDPLALLDPALLGALPGLVAAATGA